VSQLKAKPLALHLVYYNKPGTSLKVNLCKTTAEVVTDIFIQIMI